jgi:hypothetical protein
LTVTSRRARIGQTSRHDHTGGLLPLCTRLFPLLAAVFLAAALAACGDSGEEVSPTGTPTTTASDISDEDLASMVPSKADLGAEFAGYQESAAPDTNENRLENASDPDDERSDQQTFGRITGYDRELQISSSGVQADAPLLVHLGVTLIADSEGASGYMDDDLKDIQARVGQADPRLVLETVDSYQVTPLGDESLGLRTRASVSTESGETQNLYVTYVWFRRDRIIADVSLGRFDDMDMSQQAQTIAGLMDQRIQQVLDRLATPVSTP